jgi:dethiobiotin synthetase
MSVVVVTGTGTGVGKTIATAALACAARLAGIDVAVCKPVQTGTADGDDDLGEVIRLAGVFTVRGSWRYPEALAPLAAAQRSGLPLPTRSQIVDEVRDVDSAGRLTLVEGAGGLLVQVGDDGVTLRDLAQDLDASALVVVGAGLGTLNHTALTLESLAAKQVRCAGLVVGAWPAQPGPAETTNLDELERLAPVRAVLDDGAGTLTSAEFAAVAGVAFDADWLTALAR